MKAIISFVIYISSFFCFSQNLKTVNTEILNVRDGAGVEYKVIHQLYKGDTVKSLSKVELWTQIETKNGSKGYVSSEFLSNCISSNSNNISKSKTTNSWFEIIFFSVAGLILFNTARTTIFSKKGSSRNLNSNNKNIKKPDINGIKKNAVYRFRVKGNGTVGGLTYVDGMNVEVAISGLGASGSPFNTTVEKIFIQEFAKKYNVDPRFNNSIKALFKQDRLDFTLL